MTSSEQAHYFIQVREIEKHTLGILGDVGM